MGITCEDLQNCAEMARETDRLREQIIRMRAKAEGMGAQLDRRSCRGRIRDPMGTAVVNMTRLQEQWEAKIQEYSALALRIDQAITGIRDPRGRNILRMRYVDGLRWSDICERVHYSRSRVMDLHAKGLAVFSERQDTFGHTNDV